MKSIEKSSSSSAFLVSTVILIFIVAALTGPIHQPPNYHHFSDTRSFYRIPNFINIVSNIPLILAGCYWLYWVVHHRLNIRKFFFHQYEYRIYVLFFLAVILTGIGFAYYYYTPCNSTLFWARLPASIAMMTILAAIIAERVHLRTGLYFCIPLVLFGMASVFYWYILKVQNQGDLRWYGVVCFLPGALIPLILYFYPTNPKSINYPISATLTLGLAQWMDIKDEALYQLTNQTISGQSLSRIFLGVAAFLVGAYLSHRHQYLRKFRKAYLLPPLHRSKL
jgi:hypothetical protein